MRLKTFLTRLNPNNDDIAVWVLDAPAASIQLHSRDRIKSLGEINEAQDEESIFPNLVSSISFLTSRMCCVVDLFFVKPFCSILSSGLRVSI